MKYFLDTEFHEYKKKPLFGKPIDTIELISIGIVSEDFPITTYDELAIENVTRNTYREYYAICKDFDIKAAWNNQWLRENVLKPLAKELMDKHDNFLVNLYSKGITDKMFYKELKRLINKYGKTRKQIAEEIINFVSEGTGVQVQCGIKKHEFYAYYADYDWVVFCWLFGRMIGLPKGFPMYCFDLKQVLDEKAIKYDDDIYSNLDLEGKLEYLKTNSKYPKQTNEHNALADAKWNKELYKFLSNL